MNFLTPGQKNCILRKNIKVGNIYPFPMMGFTVYQSPNWTDSFEIETNPLTKSLAGQYFLVKEKKDGFCKGNFYHKPAPTDMWLSEEELSTRPAFIILILLIISFIPLSIYNLFTTKK